MAERLGITKTALAGQIIELAIMDAWETFKGGPMDPDDLARLEARKPQQQLKPMPQVPNVSLSAGLLEDLETQQPTLLAPNPTLTPLPQGL